MKVFLPNFEKRGGLVTVIVQDVDSHEILMVAYANKEAYLETLKTGRAVFWSTSRNELWRKGETSGDVLDVLNTHVDCDGDAVIYHVRHARITVCACHTGARSCFYRVGAADWPYTRPPKEGEKEHLQTVETDVHENFIWHSLKTQ